MGRSRSRSDSRSRSRSRSPRRSSRRSRSRSRSRSRDSDGYRLHVADLGIDCSKREIEKTFERFGPIRETWLARNPPCFAFIVFRHKEDAEEAVREINGGTLCGGRVRVSLALPRARGRHRRGFDPNLRCYQCGERGHFSRDCNEIWRNRGNRSSSPDRNRRRNFNSGFNERRTFSRSYSRRSRSRSRDRRSRSRDRRSRSRDRRSRSRDRRSRSRSREYKRSRSRSRGRRSKSGSAERRSKSRSREHSKSRSPVGDRKSKSPDRRSGSKSQEREDRSEAVPSPTFSDAERAVSSPARQDNGNGVEKSPASGKGSYGGEKKYGNGYADIDLDDILAVNLANEEGSMSD